MLRFLKVFLPDGHTEADGSQYNSEVSVRGASAEHREGPVCLKCFVKAHLELFPLVVQMAHARALLIGSLFIKFRGSARRRLHLSHEARFGMRLVYLAQCGR